MACTMEEYKAALGERKLSEKNLDKRINDSHKIIEQVKKYLNNNEFTDYKIYAYIAKINDEEIPIGVALYKKYEEVYIGALVTHPGSSQCGVALIEEAINFSDNPENNGTVTLKYLNKNSQKIYKALGFEMIQPLQMI